MFIQFYIFWNSAILENNLRDLPSPRAPALQARKRFVLVLLRAFRSATSRKSKACPEDLGLVWAVVRGQEKENQMLLNRFTIWCQWAQMIIRVDKCSTFGIRKQLTKSIQYLPKLFKNNCLVPRVELGKSFRYLGRYFDFNMSDEDHKSEVYDTLTNILNEIDDLPLHPKNKFSYIQSSCAFQNLLALHCFCQRQNLGY